MFFPRWPARSPTSAPPCPFSSPPPHSPSHCRTMPSSSTSPLTLASSRPPSRFCATCGPSALFLTPPASTTPSAQRSAGDVSAVLEIMSGSGASPTVPLIVTAVHKLASAGDFESARRLIDKMLEFGCVPNVVVYTALLDGMCGLGDIDAALGLVEEMEGGKLGTSCAPNVVTYTCLLKCLCGKGNLGESLGVLDRMAARGVLPNRVFMRTLVEGICAKQRVATAYAVVERLVGDGNLSSQQCYNVLLVCLWRVGMAVEAEGLAQRMMKKGVQLTPLAGSSMVRELCGRKRLLDACYWLGVMDENGVLCDSYVYADLLLGLCEEGHVLEASAVGRKVVERKIRIEASSADRLVELLKQYGDEELASHILGLRRCPEEVSL